MWKELSVSVAEAGDRYRYGALGQIEGSELTTFVVAPADDFLVFEKCAVMSAPGGDLPYVMFKPYYSNGPVCSAAVAIARIAPISELALISAAPAVDVTCGVDRTRMTTLAPSSSRSQTNHT